MTAKELLAVIQQSAAHNIQDNYKHLEELKKKFPKEDFTYLKESFDHLPTAYQNSYFYKIIESSFDTLEKTLSKTNIKYEGKLIYPKPIPLFGTAFFDELNAFAISVKNEKVIVFSEALIMFIEQLINIYTREYWLNLKGKMTPHLQDLLTKNFIDVLLCHYLFSSTYQARSIDFCEIADLGEWLTIENMMDYTSPFGYEFVEEDYLLFKKQFSMSTYLWIASHEYAHVLLGHLEDDEITKYYINNVELDKIVTNQQQELDADLLGAIITVKSESSPFLADGICFSLFSIMLSSLEHMQTSHKSSHPPAPIRIENVLYRLESKHNCYKKSYTKMHKIFDSKYKAFHSMVCKIVEDKITFSSAQEMQQYVYKTI